MFFVGVICRFNGMDQVEKAEVSLVEKLGRSKGRAIRFINDHPMRAGHSGVVWRALAFILPDRFRLSNDMIQDAMHRFKCDWQLAKFHCYREHSLDFMVKTTEWPDLIQKATEKKVDDVPQDTQHAAPITAERNVTDEPATAEV